jgi:RNA-directed DNA polymerase
MTSQESRKERADRREPSLKAKGEARGEQASAEPSTGVREQRSDGEGERLLEQILTVENLNRAVKRVEANGGAPGIDGMTVAELRPYLKAQGPELKESLQSGRYRPQPVRRVEIPKPGGGMRGLGIPTVVDRFIQQAIQQVLTPQFEPGFSAGSYGFRPGRRAHDAVKAAQGYIAEGYEWVVDIDLEKFFDRVNHEKLMARVGRRVSDRRVTELIWRYLESGVMSDGVVAGTAEGTPQGGPLSPLLSNIMLDDLDKELEKRGHRFARYADDCNIYVRSRRAGERVMASVRRFIEQRLSLKINAQKSAVDRATKRKFLGFSFMKRKAETLIRVANESRERVKAKLREFTSRTRGGTLEEIIERINGYTMGWLGYFQLADTPSVFEEVDEWLRRRLRQLLWKRWKQAQTRKHNLVALEVPEPVARKAAGTVCGPWRLSASQPVMWALNNAYWRAQGLLSLSERYHQLRTTH